jgi:hypothetical protein
MVSSAAGRGEFPFAGVVSGSEAVVSADFSDSDPAPLSLQIAGRLREKGV